MADIMHLKILHLLLKFHLFGSIIKKKILELRKSISFSLKYSFTAPLNSAARRALTGPVQLRL
jgi:hypothetical protein